MVQPFFYAINFILYMSRFNAVAIEKTITNAAGGQAYAQSPELELVSILLTSFANDQFYRSADDTFTRLTELVAVCDKRFVAQAAVYARTQFGMRSITHVVASTLAKHIGGEEWAKDFYAAVIHRPDDMLEILSYHTATNGKIPNAMKKGFARAFDKFDRYALAKYRGEGKGYKLVDVVNLVHPQPVEKNADAIKALVAGELVSTDTWESGLSKAGQVAGTQEEKEAFKKDVWVTLINERKLGYFALLRNLRNIIEQAPEALDSALLMLVDEVLIRKSLVLPFRFLTAYEEINKLTPGPLVRNTLMALTRAIDVSTANAPKFIGSTLVVLDVSGSMQGKPALIGSLFSAVLLKSNNADFMMFSDYAQYINVNPMDTTTTIASSIKFAMGGTNFRSVFDTANRPYDRIIILSDMQGWVGYTTPKEEYKAYKRRVGANPFIYSFDLSGLGSMQFPEDKVFCLAGFSDKIFEIMALLETDRNALVNKINQIKF